MAGQMGLRKTCALLLQKNVSLCGQNYSTKASKTLKAVSTSLASKGFLRPLKPYSPPEGVTTKIQAICAGLQLPKEDTYKFASLNEKFKLLNACSVELKHNVPNSRMHEIETIRDVVEFYATGVDTTVPYDAMKQMELPENLHIQYDYVRFNPETDTKFNGQTAFPKSSTLVTGLKYRGKYAGHEAKRSWP